MMAIILLAAGSSSRMGQSKQLLEIDGETLLKRAAEVAYACAGSHTLVVLGSEPEVHAKVIAHLPVHVLINRDWQKGMGSSLKAGITYLVESAPEVTAILTMVCDQPLVTKAYLDKLIQQHQLNPHKVIASSYASTVGVPALFPKALVTSMLKLEDQHGAKKILEQHANSVETVDFPEGAIDIDTSKDYEEFLSRIKDSRR